MNVCCADHSSGPSQLAEKYSILRIVKLQLVEASCDAYRAIHKGLDFVPLHSFPALLHRLFHISPTLLSNVLRSSHPTLRAPNFPHQIRNANLLARLLVVVEPLALVQLDGLEFGV